MCILHTLCILHISLVTTMVRSEGVPERLDELERLERELMLVARRDAVAPGNDGSGAADGPGGGKRLERSAYLLLSRLDAEGPRSIGQLADALRLDVSTVNRQTAALLRCGALERIQDPDGGLARKLRVTPSGAERLAAVRHQRCSGLDRILADWTPTELEEFGDVLARFNRTLEVREGHAWPRHAVADQDGAG